MTRLTPSLGALLVLLVGASSCGVEGGAVVVPGKPGRTKTAAVLRADRRAYDGAPPVVPHMSFGAACTSCHTLEGLEVPDVGYAPPTPHGDTMGLSEESRCRQCHVFRTTEEVFVQNDFVGLPQDLRQGSRLYEGAPPVMPHGGFMRENCVACHTGPAAREEIRTSHPERERCQQCHVPRLENTVFSRP